MYLKSGAAKNKRDLKGVCVFLKGKAEGEPRDRDTMGLCRMNGRKTEEGKAEGGRK